MKMLKRYSISRPQRTARVLVGHRRSEARDLSLATVLAAIAGAANAGGVFAVGKYTSHMTGYISQLADNLATLDWQAAEIASLAISAFVSGAAFSTVLINWTRHENRRHQYALALAMQGFFMLLFSFGGVLVTEIGRLFSLACLCFIMGMQNATITKISAARVRTTHATGMVTDIGIEIGRMIISYLPGFSAIAPNRRKLRILLSLVFSFLGGGLIGAIGYRHAGFFFSLPLSAILLGLSLPTLLSKTRSAKTREQP